MVCLSFQMQFFGWKWSLNLGIWNSTFFPILSLICLSLSPSLMPDENFLTLLKAMLHVSNKTAVYSRTGHRQWEHLSFIINLLLLLPQFYIAPLQANLLRSISSPTSVKQCGLKARVKYSRCVRRSATGRPFPTSHREGAALSEEHSSYGGTSHLLQHSDSHYYHD